MCLKDRRKNFSYLVEANLKNKFTLWCKICRKPDIFIIFFRHSRPSRLNSLDWQDVTVDDIISFNNSTDWSALSQCTGGAAGYIDRTVMGASHVYQYPTCQEVFGATPPHDPEGILGNLTSIIVTFFGLHVRGVMSFQLYDTSE